MKRIIVLLSAWFLFFGHLQSANYVEISFGGGIGDTIFLDQSYSFVISIENDGMLAAVSLPFMVYSPNGVTWELHNTGSSQFSPATPNGGTFVTGVGGSRWMSGAATDGSCWDLGGTLVNDNLAPDQFLIGGVALSGGLESGALEAMLEVHFAATSAHVGIGTLCIDTAFYPPGASFVFEPGGAAATNLPVCYPVFGEATCPSWDDGNPTGMETIHCNPGQVTVSATNPVGDDVHYYIASTTGDGIATVGLLSGIVTYRPAPSDVGQPIQIEIQATHPIYGPSWCLDYLALDITVTNTPPTIDCGLSYNLASPPNLMTKSDIAAEDDDACDDPVYFIQDITPLPNGSYAIDPATGEFTFTPAENDLGYFTVCVGGTDGADTAICCFDVDVYFPEECLGDVTGDCQSNVADATFLVNYIFKYGPPPDIMNWADVNADCAVNVADVVYILAYIFRGGPEPQLGCVYQ